MSTANTETVSAPDRQTLEWHAGDMPYSHEFGDHFYCREDGRLECSHVFLGGNGLPERWRDRENFRIGELGFGTGLNFCETWRQWKEIRRRGSSLRFISFERFPMKADDIGRALSRWPQIEAERQTLCALWPKQPAGQVAIDLGEGMHLTVACGNALDEITRFDEGFDAWYLDGFAPRRNPDMWSLELMRRVWEKTVDGGTFATYAAAGFVRRNLQDAGFSVERRPGFGSKREMLRGVKSPGRID